MRWIVKDDESKVELNEKVEVVLSEAAYNKMMTYASLVTGEISGMGEVKKEGILLYVTDVWLLKQECTGASTTIKAEALADLRAEMYQKKLALDGFRLWWHSHADMGVFWSGTDTSTMKALMVDIDWMLSIVVNKKRELRARVDFREPLEMHVDNLKVMVDTMHIVDEDELKKEVKEKVSDRAYTPRKQHWLGHNGGYPYGYGGGWDGETDRDVTMSADEVFADKPLKEKGEAKFPEEYKTPGARGDLYWKVLNKAERKLVKRFAKEKAPLCVPAECGECKKYTFVFYVREGKCLFCLTCLKDAAAKGLHVVKADRLTPEVDEKRVEALRLGAAVINLDRNGEDAK